MQCEHIETRDTVLPLPKIIFKFLISGQGLNKKQEICITTQSSGNLESTNLLIDKSPENRTQMDLLFSTLQRDVRLLGSSPLERRIHEQILTLLPLSITFP